MTLKNIAFNSLVVVAILACGGCSALKQGESTSNSDSALNAVVRDLGITSSEENKSQRYEQIYNETPEVIYIAPVVDLSKFRAIHDPADSAYNREISVAAHYLYQSMAAPLNHNGYYAISNMTAREMARVESNTTSELKNSDLTSYATLYGADAVLFATIHRWDDKIGIWTAYIDFTLRSTRTGSVISHTAVKATKQALYSLTGQQIEIGSESNFGKELSLDGGTAQRCLLLEAAARYVLQDLPLCRTTRQYCRDLYNSAIGNYISFTLNDDGKFEVLPISMEDFEPPKTINKK